MISIRQIQETLGRHWRWLLAAYLLALIPGMVTLPSAEVEYRAEMSFIVSQPPLPSTLTLEEERYFTWVTSEYVVYGVSDWINGTIFAQRVVEQLQSDPARFGLDDEHVAELDAETLFEMIDSSAVRSRLVLAARGDDEQLVAGIARAAQQTLLRLDAVDIPQLAPPLLEGDEADQTELLAQLATVQPVIMPLDSVIVVDELGQSLLPRLAIPLRLLLALLAPLVVALLFVLRDKTIYGPQSVQRLGIPVIGEIPGGG